jgi:exopolysaccharide production protein ExoF
MWKRAIFATLAVASVFGSMAANAADYALGIEDKLRVKVYEWRSTLGEVHEWSSLTGEFTIGPSGTIALPLIGEVPAAGQKVSELAQAISHRLQSKIGLAEPPDTSIEIVRFRPFYILGNVDHPGEYPFQPGLTVLQALSIAGGMYRPADPGMQLERTTISTTGSLRAQRLEAVVLTARAARLQAELDGKDTIEFPAELTQRRTEPAVARAMHQEEAAFATRGANLRMQTDAISQSKELLNKELAALKLKIANQDHELTEINAELLKVGSFVKQGLAVAPREFSLRQNQIEIQGRRLDLDTAVLRAREEIGKSDERIVELRAKRHAEILADLQSNQARLTEVTEQIRTNNDLLAANEASGPALDTSSDNQDTVTFSIIRRVGADLRETVVPETAAVEPNDTIKVKRNSLKPSERSTSAAPQTKTNVAPQAKTN